MTPCFSNTKKQKNLRNQDSKIAQISGIAVILQEKILGK